jgi:hypothetical protein
MKTTRHAGHRLVTGAHVATVVLSAVTALGRSLGNGSIWPVLTAGLDQHNMVVGYFGLLLFIGLSFSRIPYSFSIFQNLSKLQKIVEVGRKFIKI